MECPVSERPVGGGTRRASGEVAERLQAKLGESVLFLVDRRRGSGRERGDIDVIAVASTGVWVIDPRTFVGEKVRAPEDTFVVDGRRRPELAVRLRRQVATVQAAVLRGPVPDAPVNALHCFVGADLPFRPLAVAGVDVTTIRGARRRLQQPGPLDAVHRTGLHAHLGLELPRA